VKKVLLEGLAVAVIGATLAFAANALSPRGLHLNEDYFRGTQRPPASAPIANNPSANTNSQTDTVAAELKAKGLQAVDGNRALGLFQDPLYQTESIIFLDARDDQHYREGHIPGAYQFDNYHPENYIATVFPVCQKASQIVVYCNGGNCEDSQFAALRLRDDLKIPGEKLFVYVGGITEWTARSRPIETGERKSGKLRASGK